jgi:hypothetical protein
LSFEPNPYFSAVAWSERRRLSLVGVSRGERILVIGLRSQFELRSKTFLSQLEVFYREQRKAQVIEKPDS